MGRTYRVSRALVAAAVGGALIAPSLAATVSAQDPVTFRVGITESPSPTAMNPYLAVIAEDWLLFGDQYDLLTGFGPNLEPAPGLAESWAVSDDGLTWTYKIRPGVTWSDGTPFTAEDVRFQYQYIRDSHDPAYVGPQAPNGNDLVDGDGNPTPDGSADNPLSLFDSYLDLDGGLENSRITSIAAPDDSTLVITTSAPLATLNQIYIPILPKHIWQDITFEDAAVSPLSVEQSVGTGPFRMVQFDPEQAVILEGRDEYWGGGPYIDELVYQFFDNDEAQVNALISGDVDYLNLFPPTLAQKLQEAPGVTVNTASSSDLGELGFNSWAPTPERFVDEGCADCPRGPTTGSMGDPWLTRADVRAALAGLLDKQALIDFAQSGFAEPGVSVVSPLSERFSYAPPEGDPVTFPAYTKGDQASQDAARAAAETRFRDAMAAIGFTDTDGNGILNVPSDDASVAFDPEGAGSDWTFRLHVRDTDSEDKLAAPLIAKWFGDAGVAVEWQAVSTDELTRLAYPYASNADIDMYMWGWGPDPDPDFILSIFTCDQINNWGDANYCDPAYDELYRSQRGQLDPEERAATIKALQDKVYHDAPYAVIWYINNLEAYRSDRWEGMQAVPAGKGAWWSAAAGGPYGSRVTVRPIGTPLRSASPGATTAP